MSSVPYTFANNTGNIPLSHLDVNFANCKGSADYVIANAQANITSVGTLTVLSVDGNILGNSQLSVAGNITTSSQITAANTITGGNIVTGGNIIAGGNIITGGTISAAGNIRSASVYVAGEVSATGNVVGQFISSAGGNIGVPSGVLTMRLGHETPTTIYIGGNASNIFMANTNSTTTIAGNLTVGADISLSGNIVVAGNATINGTTTTINTQNLTVADKNIIVANGVSTSALIDGAGIDAGSPTVAYIRYSNASQGWTTANNLSVGSNLSVTGTTILGGIATAPTAANGTSNTQIATTEFVKYNGFPSGGIAMWSGSIASIPSGWFLCDGNNGTPNLTDRFIVGAGNIYSVGGTGGSANAVVVSHNHTATVTDPGHAHNYTRPSGAPNNAAGGIPDYITITTGTTSSATTGITVDIGSTGSSATNANLPPYYALAYIMKA